MGHLFDVFFAEDYLQIVDRRNKLPCQTLYDLIVQFVLPFLHDLELDVDHLGDPIEEQVSIEVKTQVQIVILLDFFQLLDAIFHFIKLIT